jgi:phosphoribosylanthranilate isomerase
MKLKICGITNIADIEFLNQFPVDYIGFVLHEASVRNVPMFVLPKLVAQVSHVIPAAVCVNQNALSMQEIYNITGIKVMQLHV